MSNLNVSVGSKEAAGIIAMAHCIANAPGRRIVLPDCSGNKAGHCIFSGTVARLECSSDEKETRAYLVDGSQIDIGLLLVDAFRAIWGSEAST